MTPGRRTAEYQAGRAGEIIEACRRHLESEGFARCKRNTLWRRTNLKFDVLQFDIIPKGRREKWRVPPGSFLLNPSCLFPFLPLSAYRRDEPLRPDKDVGQIRLWVERGVSQPSIRAPNIWWPGNDMETFEIVLRDVTNTITTRILPFFRRFEDPEELMRTLLEDEQRVGPGGIWEFGTLGSPRRLLYAGFAAIECEKWGLAVSTLQACAAAVSKAEARFPPELAGSVGADILPYVEEGLLAAERERHWSLDAGR